MVLGKYMINCKLHLTLTNEGLDKTQYINKKDEIDLLKDVRKNSSIDCLQQNWYEDTGKMQKNKGSFSPLNKHTKRTM